VTAHRSSSAAGAATTVEALREEGGRVRVALAAGRSDTLLRLFDFLLDQSLEGRQPNERDIANAIFDDTPSQARGQGQNGRVYVFRLRRKLDEYYAGKRGPRLLIPRGEYCILLSQPDPDSGERKGRLRPPGGGAGFRGKALLAAAVPFAAIIAWIGWIGWSGGERAAGSLAETAFWRPLADHRPETLVIGDYFLFGEQAGPGLPTRIIRDPSISSREEFHARLVRDPPGHGNLVDLNLQFVTSNAVYAFRSIWSSLRQIRGRAPDDVTMISASQLDPDILKTSDVIYLGPLDGLGKLLRNPLFQASGFKIGASYRELIDKSSGRHFTADGWIPTGNQIPRKDYGYIASLPGPSGNRILIIAGTGDAGTVQMAGLASRTGDLEQLRKRLGKKADAFEALYQVRAMYSQNYGSTLLMARPITHQSEWDTSAASQIFPDDRPASERRR